MGVLDHRKTWHFLIRADDEQCLQAFHQAMSKPGFKLLAATWTVEAGLVPVDLSHKEASQPGCIATYQGRAGLIGIMTALIGRARNEEQNAVGSQVTFTVSPDAVNDRTECSMWLSKWSTSVLGFIADARFFRSSMNDVEKQLRVLDLMLTVDKG